MSQLGQAQGSERILGIKNSWIDCEKRKYQRRFSWKMGIGVGTRKIKSVNSGWEERCLGKRRFQRGNSRPGLGGRKEEIREKEDLGRGGGRDGRNDPGKKADPRGAGNAWKNGKGMELGRNLEIPNFHPCPWKIHFPSRENPFPSQPVPRHFPSKFGAGKSRNGIHGDRMSPSLLSRSFPGIKSNGSRVSPGIRPGSELAFPIPSNNWIFHG